MTFTGLIGRVCMFPLGRQAAINAQKMQELQPEMKRINDLYKEDMQKRAEATRELKRVPDSFFEVAQVFFG